MPEPRTAIRLDAKQKAQWTAYAAAHGLSVTELIKSAVEEKIGTKLPGPAPFLVDSPVNDSEFDILEWAPDDPLRTSGLEKNINVRVSESMFDHLHDIVNMNDCPYSNISQLVRDFIVTGAVIVTSGRLKDERARQWAKRQYTISREAAVTRQRKNLDLQLQELQAAVDNATSTSRSQRAVEGYKQLARMLATDMPASFVTEAYEKLAWLRGQMDQGAKDWMDRDYPELAEGLVQRGHR
jgi:hypothetical protein